MSAGERERAVWRAGATAVAQYETVALWTNLPTVTRGVHKHPLFGVAILIGLAVHFFAPLFRGLFANHSLRENR